jgi:ATPase family associated with various cellular activities (AAA)
MSDVAQWQKDNEQYLAAALTWLRLQLERRAGYGITLPVPQPPSPPPAVMETEPPPPVKRRLLLRRQMESAAAASRAKTTRLLPPAPHVTEEQVAEAAAAMAQAESKMQPPPALTILAERFGLSTFERNVLLLCVAMEFDTRVPALCAQAQEDASRRHPTFALALALFPEAATWDSLSPERPLRHYHLVDIHQPGPQPLITSALCVDEWVVNYIKGSNYLDDRLAHFLVPLEVAEAEIGLPPSHRKVVETIVHSLEHAPHTERLPVIQLLGVDSPSKRLVAWHAAAALGLHLYRMPAALLPQQAAELETLVRLWHRQAVMMPVCLYLDAGDAASAGGQSESQSQPPVNRFLARGGGVVFLDTREAWPRLDRASLIQDVSKPTTAEQQSAWASALGEAAHDNPERLSSQFNLNLTEIQQIAKKTLAEAAAAGEGGFAPESFSEQIWDYCLTVTRPRLDALAHRLEPKAKWKDIVLPESEIELLHHITNQVRQRNKVYDEWGFRRKMSYGLSVNALFTGESGTGKTMAAEVIANELRLNLYRIDLSAVVSKYIGETEKNLARLFDLAEDGGMMLFFDEADAIFGKRSEVKDAHDRYANIEINYLLQRMESYRGLAILATNMKSALDTAFMRRLRFIVNFPTPGLTERKLIWQKSFPPEVPLKDLDYDYLARFNFAGGSIHSVALNASFLAAQSGTLVTMPLVLQATRLEYIKRGWPFSEADFQWETEDTEPDEETEEEAVA